MCLPRAETIHAPPQPARVEVNGQKGPGQKKSTQTCAAQWSMQITAPTAPAPEHIPTSSIPPGLSSSSFGPSEVYSQRCRLEVLSCTHLRRQREKLEGNHKFRSDFLFCLLQAETDLTGMMKTLGGGLIIEKRNDIHGSFYQERQDPVRNNGLSTYLKNGKSSCSFRFDPSCLTHRYQRITSG